MKIWSGQDVPRIGMGCWAIGGSSYSNANDKDSRAGLRLAYEMGARVFDTAAVYGSGHSETLVGDEVSQFEDAVIITKFGYEVDGEKKITGGPNTSEENTRKVIDDSRRRLKRDKLDLALLHLNGLPLEEARPAFDVMDALVAENKIAAYGWSSDDPNLVSGVIDRNGFVAVENDFNIFTPATQLMDMLADRNKLSICRLPLAMGLLTGKYAPDSKLPADDIRGKDFDWLLFFKNGTPNTEFLDKLGALRELLTTGDRSLAQGALGWILAKSDVALPVPGFRTEQQVADNIGAAEKGPLPADIMAEIDTVLEGFRTAK